MLYQHDELEQMEEAPFGDQLYNLDGREMEPPHGLDDEQLFYQLIDDPHRVSMDLRRWFHKDWMPDRPTTEPWSLTEMLTAPAAFEQWLGRRITHEPAPIHEVDIK